MERIHKQQELPSRGRTAEGFTVAEYAKKFGMSIAGATHRLRALQRQGEVVSTWALMDGRRCKVYRPA